MRVFTLVIILILYPLIIFSQIDSGYVIVHRQDEIDTVSRFKVSDPRLQFSSIDLTPWQTFKDSGFIDNNGLKEGFWIEYPIDTSKLAMDNSFPTGSIKEGVYEPQLLKLTGTYVSGKKEGTWILFWASLRTPPYFWGIFRSTEYRSDIKNGIETYYNPFSNEISMQIIYRDGELIKIEKQ